MSETWKAIFAFAGMVFVFVFVLGLLYAIYEWLKDRIADARWEYRYKHRFDKPPTAKCYCKDCKLHGTKSQHTNRCYLPGSDRFTPDNGFCYEAEPRDKEPPCQS